MKTKNIHHVPVHHGLLFSLTIAVAACGPVIPPKPPTKLPALPGLWVLHRNADGANFREHAIFNDGDYANQLQVKTCAESAVEVWDVDPVEMTFHAPDEELSHLGYLVNDNLIATDSDGDEGWRACRVSEALSFAAGDFSLSHNDEVLFTQTDDVCAWTTAINESGVATVFEEKAARLKLALTADAWVVGDNPVSGEIHVDSRDISVFVSGTLTLDEQVGADWRGAFVLHDDNPAADASADAFTGTIDVALPPECER